MSQLLLQFFGTFGASRDGAAITTFRSDKARALLAFLVLEADRPHRREALAAMFWPEQSEDVARANLRQTLSRLKRALGDEGENAPLLGVERLTLQFQFSRDVSIDAQAFMQLLDEVEQHLHDDLATCAGCLGKLETAAALYRGDLLHGLSIRGSEKFEEWLTVERERFQQRALELLAALTDLTHGGATTAKLKTSRGGSLRSSRGVRRRTGSSSTRWLFRVSAARP